MTIPIKEGTRIHFRYTNWKGTEGARDAQVISFKWGSTEYHKEPQMLLHAYDLNKRDFRDFAVKDMKEVSLILDTII